MMLKHLNITVILHKVKLFKPPAAQVCTVTGVRIDRAVKI